MKYQIYRNATGIILPVYVSDISSPIAGGLTGLVPTSSGLKCYYKKSNDTSVTLLNLRTGTVGSYVASGLVEISTPNAPGDYELCLPDAAFAYASATNNTLFLTATLYGANNMSPVKVDIQLMDPITTTPSTITEPSGVPAYPCTTVDAIAWMFQRSSSVEQCTATQSKVLKRDGTTVIGTAPLTDDGVTLTRGLYS